MPLYFAYGSNMDEASMGERCPQSKPIAPAVLHRHRFVIMAEGFASVVRDPQASVYGLLWDVALADVRALDRYESIETGLYRKITQPVKRIGGLGVRPLQQALLYVGRGEGGGAPMPGYLENVIACAERLEFPPRYTAFLQSIAANGTRRSMSIGADRSGMNHGRRPIRTAMRDETGRIVVRPRHATPFDRES